MKLNGKYVCVSSDISLTDFLEQNGCNIARIAVELNGEIIPKASYASVILSESDVLEVVTFVGGG